MAERTLVDPRKGPVRSVKSDNRSRIVIPLALFALHDRQTGGKRTAERGGREKRGGGWRVQDFKEAKREAPMNRRQARPESTRQQTQTRPPTPSTMAGHSSALSCASSLVCCSQSLMRFQAPVLTRTSPGSGTSSLPRRWARQCGSSSSIVHGEHRLL